MDIHRYLERTDRRCRYPDNIVTADANDSYSRSIRERFFFIDVDGLAVRGACETHLPDGEGPVIQIMIN